MLTAFFEAFIPLFVAIDPPGMVPVFLGVTGRLSTAQQRRLTYEAVSAGLLICVGFMVLGQAVFHFMGITPADFRIAGGVLLLVLAVIDLLIPGKPAVNEQTTVGIVPLATPLIAGPATLTTLLVLYDTHGLWVTSLALAVNFALLLVALLAAGRIARLLGPQALGAVSKLVMIVLAAYAVMFIRSGVVETVRAMGG